MCAEKKKKERRRRRITTRLCACMMPVVEKWIAGLAALSNWLGIQPDCGNENNQDLPVLMMEESRPLEPNAPTICFALVMAPPIPLA